MASPDAPGGAADWLQVESLDLEGQGIARRADGKVVFIEGALPGESVQVRIQRRKNQWEQGEAVAWRRYSPMRVLPRCPHFGTCGGCKLQHLEASAQVAIKQRVLEDQLWHLGKVRPIQVLRPISGPTWGYRHRARLSVRYVPRKGRVLVGFHERKSRYVADMRQCEVLPPAVSALIEPLQLLIMGLDGRDRMPQIEVAVGTGCIALALRHLEPLSPRDRAALAAFGVLHRVQWWLQPGGPATVAPLDAQAGRLDANAGDPAPRPLAGASGGPSLYYDLPAHGLRMPFRPTDFTQVNLPVNEVMVDQALRWLQVEPGDSVIDWFCGLGNFTLPLARRAAHVLGLEGSEALVQRARANAAAAGLSERTAFETVNLFEVDAQALRQRPAAARWLIDPPREGAFALARALAELSRQHAAGDASADAHRPRRIVYVSCNPATLARDTGLLVHRAGYRCVAAGVVNMFPHTAHVESMAIFELDPQAVIPLDAPGPDADLPAQAALGIDSGA